MKPIWLNESIWDKVKTKMFKEACEIIYPYYCPTNKGYPTYKRINRRQISCKDCEIILNKVLSEKFSIISKL